MGPKTLNPLQIWPQGGSEIDFLRQLPRQLPDSSQIVPTQIPDSSPDSFRQLPDSSPDSSPELSRQLPDSSQIAPPGGQL